MATKGKLSIIRSAALVVGLLAGTGLGTSGLAAAQAIPPEGLKLQLSPTAGPVGSAVVASGSYYGGPSPLAMWSEPVALYFAGSLVAKGATDSHGVFSIPFDIPDVEPGKYQVTALGKNTRRTAWGVFSVTLGGGDQIPTTTKLPVILPFTPGGSTVGLVAHSRCSNVDLSSDQPRHIPDLCSAVGRAPTPGSWVRLSQTATGGPSITVLPRTGPGGAVIHIRGRGFQQDTYFCATDIFFTDANGTSTLIKTLPFGPSTFKTRARIPAGAAIGSGTVTAYDGVFASCMKLMSAEAGFAVIA